MAAIDASHSRCLIVTILAFVVWKAILGLVVYCSPGVGYDTSSSLLEQFDSSSTFGETPSGLQHFLTKLVRWDAIYFTQIAERNYVFEQEWAFSFVFSKLISAISQVFASFTDLNEFQAIALSGTLVSHLAHLGSACILYFLTNGIYRKSGRGNSIALTAALLHIISPAGVFLSAPYSESLFSLLNISGFTLYVRGMNRDGGHATFFQRLQVVTAGLIFGLATTVRSNGILSGLPFLYDFVARIWAVVHHGLNTRRLYDLGSLVMGGMLVSFGLIVPQFIGYRMYCVNGVAGARQPWCAKPIPSIYAWVQQHYWVNGLFRYWTLSNLPLFLLAAPMLCVLGYTAIQVLWPDSTTKTTSSSGTEANKKASKADEAALVRLALPQLVLAVLTLSMYNVQIITRLSSGYPLWYISLAGRIVGSSDDAASKESSFIKNSHIISFMIMYAVIQGGLFASFLPPA